MNISPDSGFQLEDFVNGSILLVNKPADWTSFDVVNKIRNTLKHALRVKKIKVGHSGTLDPMATGLLIICTGKATRQLADFQNLSKEYEGTLMLGGCTPSYDAETPVEEEFPVSHITTEAIEAARMGFLGDIAQVPPMFSAIKVDGQPLYKRARKGETIEVKAREVSIYSFDLTRIAIPEIDFQVACSKGTYIRSLAHDFGKALQSGAYLTALHRTRIGDYSIDGAWELPELIDAIRAKAE